MAAPDSSLWTGFKSDHHRTAPTLDQTDTKSTLALRQEHQPEWARPENFQGGLCKDEEIQRPRRSAPERARPHHLKFALPTSVQVIVGRPRMIYPKITANARSTPYQSDNAKLFCQFLFQESRFPETILQPGMFVVDGA